MKKAIQIDAIDSSSGVLLPYYDHDTRIVYLAGKVCFKILTVLNEVCLYIGLMKTVTVGNFPFDGVHVYHC